ncbi:hypothetical protein [Orientia tsutsugamushi]|nr:hypothetical protein [Orientia tsutsugamushi]
MPLFIYYYYYLYSFHISILCTYFLRSCYIHHFRKVYNITVL